jgi:hypothetical protein
MSGTDAPQTLWIADGGARFFSVPDDAELPEGDLELRTLGGKRRSADPEAATRYELSVEDGQAAARAEVTAFGGALRDAFARGLSALAGLGPDAAELREAREARTAAVFGLSQEAMNDPQKLKEAGAAFVDGLLVAAREGARDPDAAARTLAPVAAQVRAAGGERVADLLEALPGTVNEVLRDERTIESLDAFTARLRAATAELRKKP